MFHVSKVEILCVKTVKSNEINFSGYGGIYYAMQFFPYKLIDS